MQKTEVPIFQVVKTKDDALAKKNRTLTSYHPELQETPDISSFLCKKRMSTLSLTECPELMINLSEVNFDALVNWFSSNFQLTMLLVLLWFFRQIV